jgi:hypothetical protein
MIDHIGGAMTTVKIGANAREAVYLEQHHVRLRLKRLIRQDHEATEDPKRKREDADVHSDQRREGENDRDPMVAQLTTCVRRDRSADAHGGFCDGIRRDRTPALPLSTLIAAAGRLRN